MKQKRIILLTLVFISTCSVAFTALRIINARLLPANDITFPNWSTYNAEWSKVDSLQNKGLPKSALEVVMAIYQKARSENNAPQVVKSIIYRMKFQSYTQEDEIKIMIADLQQDCKSSGFPAREVLHSVLAEIYWKFYQQNRYRFLNRTETVDFVNDDILTWDLKKIIKESIHQYNLSLANKDSLKLTSVSAFDPVITKETPEESRKMRPTLFDFLAHRAIDFYLNDESGLTQPADGVEIDSAAYLAPANRFAGITIHTHDTLSMKFNALRLLQELIAFHLKDGDPAALIDADLKRLIFVHNHIIVKDKDALYIGALRYLAATYHKYPDAADALYNIASFYYDKGKEYKPGQTDSLKWYYRKTDLLCDSVIKQYSSSHGAHNCDYLKTLIHTKSLAFNVENVNMPDAPFRTKVDYRNVNKIYLRIAKNDLSHGNKLNDQVLSGIYLTEHYLSLVPLKEWTQDLTDDGDYQQHAVEIKMPPLPFGNYVIIAANNSSFRYNGNAVTYATTWISNISFLSRSMQTEGGCEFYVMERETGKPMEGVTANAWTYQYNSTLRKNETTLAGAFTSDENGYFTVPPLADNSYHDFSIEFIKGDDRLYMTDNYYTHPERKEEYKPTVQTTFFTDRAIYRPGQTIYFKGIIIQKINDENDIVVQKETTIGFYDVNNQKIADLNLTTNDYGTFNGSFTAPQGVLAGAMTIKNENGSIQLRVEEYKRPKFEVSIFPLKESYRPGDKVTVHGNAVSYSGANVTDAEVKYRVVRSARIPYWFSYWRGYMPPSSPDMQVADGETTTNDSGGFSISFPAIPDYTMAENIDPTFTYKVTVDVTDINGETHSQSRSVSAGYKALIMNIDIPNEVNSAGKKDFRISTTDLSGQPIPAAGTISIYKLKDQNRLLRKRLWSHADEFSMTREEYEKNFPMDIYDNEDMISKRDKEAEVLNTGFDTQKDSLLIIEQLSSWKQGAYMLEMNSKDKYGLHVKMIRYFTLFNPKETLTQEKKEDWFSVLKSQVEPGEKAQMLIGSSDKDVKVLYEIEKKKEIVSKQWLTLNNEQKLVELPIEEKDRGNIAVHFIFIKHNRIYQHDQTITVPWTNKKLDISFETFRDKLKPGSSEEWKIKIKDKAGDKIMAEMAATLYDASLDAFAANHWNFNIYSSYYSACNFNSGQEFSYATSALTSNNWNKSASPYSRSYDQLNWFGFYMPSCYRGHGYNTMFAREESLSEETVTNAPARDISMVDKASGLTIAEPSQPSKKEAEQTSLSDVKSRTNLNETAFFYPELHTDSNGELVISFTVPEALTKWKMLGFAHTQDLKYGQIEKQLVTQKELMVQPNPPRFFREGDTISFPAKVTNLSDSDLTGSAELFLYDALSMQPLNLSPEPMRNFTVRKGQSASMNWSIIIPESVDAITYKVTAKAGNFSDGEEQALPVLSDRMLVTESLPLSVRSKQTRKFEFTKLLHYNSSSTLRNHKLTLEYSANPAWYAIQALPYMMEYPYECSEQIFARYYANAIASHIANSSPRIKAVFDSWKSRSPDAFLSALEKNQELKSLMLEETPWVMDAKNESERKKRVGLLFDLNKMSSELNGALLTLQNRQGWNGAWPWFTGGPDDPYITQYIMEGMGHLDHLGVKNVREDARTWSMVQKAVLYCDSKMNEDYIKLTKTEGVDLNQDHLGGETIHYLYARSYFKDIPVNGNYKKAFDYYLGQAKKYWLTRSQYFQGMIALALYRNNVPVVPMDIIRSLKEYSQHSEEMGMYWKNNTGGFMWYEAPVETQALLIETFDEVASDSTDVDEMKIWLLRQKQTQDWKTTKATAEACYALLLRGVNWLAEDTPPEITVGDTKITTAYIEEQGGSVEAGTGYFKTSWSGNEIKPEMANVSVQNKNNIISWGALYWQYFEQLDKITSAETTLKLEKKLFLEQSTPTGLVITPITENTHLKAGDRIKVRIELRVDRNMQYVMMKDMRASGLEPENVLSVYKYQDGLGYYESTRDASTNFFFNWLTKGTYVFEYPLRVAQAGDFANGITSIQCMYAPEFGAHSEGVRVHVK